MGNLISCSISCDVWMDKISQWLDKKVGYIHDLEKNLATLENSMVKLKAKRNDLLRKATREEDKGGQRLGRIPDDIWEKVDLTEIGVPFPAPENRCKVVFTTRRQDVCWTRNIRKRSRDPQACKRVARKCGGLPLALNVIGETMSCKKTVEEWRHAKMF
ncbi:unnamed protein product [Microthlaspi erraticum]|uniref:NB-ARC domain-containing protein n=1 Tax=Microthlaspi erraticum TaxID=1685480 RepID=A0A6D2J000_9BRAS|nr:unnamed protein product [Microthlaspi erraticum]